MTKPIITIEEILGQYYYKGLNFMDFIVYKTGKSSNELTLPTIAYWKSLEDVLRAYVRHSDNKFDYIDGIAHRKHINIDRIRYIGKEANNLDETEIFGIDDESYIEYENLNEFKDWVLGLKPKDVSNLEISKRELNRFKQRPKIIYKTKLTKALITMYKKGYERVISQ